MRLGLILIGVCLAYLAAHVVAWAWSLAAACCR